MTENKKQEEIYRKKEKLENYLRELQELVVAFSGGVDSTYLLQAAHDVLGDRVLAVTVDSCLFPGRELSEAKAFCDNRKIRQVILKENPLECSTFYQNPPNRCYICKKNLFQRIQNIAKERKFLHVAEGSNVDDMGDYRPGLQAIEELKIVSPLRVAGLTKAEIRRLSKEGGLPTWEKPSFACLATRFAYGETITAQGLARIEEAEQYLFEQGFTQVRVRHHGEMARIEILPEEFPRMLQSEIRAKLTDRLKELGFQYVTLDLEGYRTGSMNEIL